MIAVISGIYAAIFGLIAGVASFSAWLSIRRMRATAIVGTLASIVGNNLPLGAALRAAARVERGKLRRILERMARHIELGDAVSTALRCAYPACPGHISGAVLAAERGGTLPGVLRSLAAEAHRQRSQPAELAAPVLYSFVMLVFVPSTLLFLLVSVFPKFAMIFEDFGTNMPRLTERLIDWSAFIQANYAVCIIILLGVVTALLCIVVAPSLLVRSPDRFQAVRAVPDALSWYLPGVRQVVANRAAARQLPVMQAAIRSGHDLPEAARQAACVAVNHFARRRLRRWAERIEYGVPPADAAQRCGLPGAWVRAVRTAQGPAELSAAFEYLTEYYRRIALHWNRVLASFLLPLIVLSWGVCVACIAVAFILPLATLIESLAKSIY